MRKIICLLSFVFTTIAVSAQFYSDAQNEYRLYEKLAAEKRLTFNPNPNTLNYDVKYHKLELTINPANYYISGEVTTQFVPYQNLMSIVFDLSHQLTVSSVTQGTQSLIFSQANNELTIQLAQTVTSGTQGEIKITYAGMPPTDNEAFVQSSHAGIPIIWTLSEPFGARDWWPCKQSLNDKIENIDLYLRTPSHLVAVANGLEQSQVVHSDGTKTTYFKHNYPIPAYLVAIAVTNYQIYNQTAGTVPNTFPVVNYLYPETYNSAVSQLGVTLPIMSLFEDKFGTYPFANEKYGHAQFGWGGGMEHTTVSFMGSFSRGLIAHELAHHWFGNKVTCGSWKDIWINEGFAEYMSGLVVEDQDGVNAFIDWKTNKINNITKETWGNLYLYDPQVTDADRIFNSRLTYNKGSMVVHMLRYVVGDSIFYQGMRNFLNDPAIAYNYALTPQVKQHLEAVSGKNLTEFFNDWVYGEGYPTYSIDAQTFSSTKTIITLSQKGSHVNVPFFEMPVTLRLTGVSGNSEIVVLNHTTNNQRFVVDTNVGTVNKIEIDPFKDIISKNNTITLDVNKVTLENDISIYPNPFKNEFEISLSENILVKKMELFDGNGRLVQKHLKNRVDASQLSSGTYVLVVQTENETFHKKLIKN